MMGSDRESSIAPDALLGIAGFVEQARDDTRTASGLIAVNIRKAQASSEPGDASLRFAYDHVQKASEAADRAVKALDALGVPLPKQAVRLAVAEERTDPLDLSTLSGMDTVDTRELLALLTQAQEVAERVDAARGLTLPAHLPVTPGESRGTDLAEAISFLTLRLRGEVFGQAAGRE